LLEIGEGKGANDVMLVDHLPMRPIGKLFVDVSQFLALQRRNSAAAGNTSLRFERWHRSYWDWKMSFLSTQML
jgi:hypothetical protein